MSHIMLLNVIKIDITTSCDDLIVESIEQGSSSKGKKGLSPTTMMTMSSSRMRMKSSRRILKSYQPSTQL